ncbi:hypothetical protein EBBID32_18120 [Sphingobium indicum BiD32]|uniref:Uncharacterized protein n=1 Tax=Sphingobium indicum BiD32 TaxID=1301087 RepID=N1MP84_9SPHN|nr:hypothetical protein [Sphingobium indicum]CCW17472.1 hypothetical protein EBBID32_18120 [Sphingobium indicum BiD32]
MKISALGLLALSGVIWTPSAAIASQPSGGQITYVTTMSNGVILFDVSGPRTTRPACASLARWGFNGSTAAGQAKLAGLLTAYARQVSVNVYGTATCVSWGDTEEVDYFNINQ